MDNQTRRIIWTQLIPEDEDMLMGLLKSHVRAAKIILAPNTLPSEKEAARAEIRRCTAERDAILSKYKMEK